MKRILSVLLTLMVLFSYTGAAYAIQETKGAAAKLQAAPNARTIELAFVFDGPSDKNQSVLKTFQLQLLDHYYRIIKLLSLLN